MKFILLLFALISISCGCSSTLEKDNSLARIDILKIESWLNLMPGGPASFHIAGEVKIINYSERKLERINLVKINIYQNESLIYEVTPFFNNILSEDDNILEQGEGKTYLFGTRPGLPIRDRLNPETFISAELHFQIEDDVITRMVDSLNIDKAY